MKSRNVFLFGAGAAIDWEGPTTGDLTRIILKSGFKTKKTDITNTQFIYSKLLSRTNIDHINFETIIDAIEELIIFYSRDSDSININNSFFKCDFDEEDFFNFDSSPFKKNSPNLIANTLTKEQEYLIKLLNNLLTQINNQVFKYTSHTEKNNNVFAKNNEEINSLFVKWIENKKNDILRLYTLNYDDLFKALLENKDVSVFDGFKDLKETTFKGCKPDFERLLNDFENNIHYNLHGSSYWKVIYNEDNRGPKAPLIIKKDFIVNGNDSRSSNVELEKGKNLILNNIITGYKKIQRTSFPPLKQMNYAFDKDVITANTIYIVGYSFGDEHINQSIKTALKVNPHLKIKIICFNYKKHGLNQKLANPIFNYSSEESITENIYSYKNGNIIVYDMKFKDFLKNHTNV
jgi:hypothetical protein